MNPSYRKGNQPARFEARIDWWIRAFLVVAGADPARSRDRERELAVWNTRHWSLALSLDRGEIRYGPGGYLVIAPKQQRQFLEELARRAPNLVRRGQDFSVPFSPLA